MASKARLVIFATCVGLGLTAVFFVQERDVQEDPFSNLFLAIYQSDWRESRLQGEVSGYQSPLTTRDGPEGGWGDRSIHFEVSFPLEDDLIGHSSDGDFVIYCYQQSLSAIALFIADIPASNMPPAILKAALAETASNTARYLQDDGQIYIRQCYTTVSSRDPDLYNQNQGLDGSEEFYLFGRCIDAVQKRFRGADQVTYDAENNVFSMLRVASVDGDMGTAIGTLCRQSTHPSGFLHVYTWYLPTST